MRTPLSILSGKYRDIVTRIGAVFRAQREIDARRVLQRYRHLIEQPHETSLLNRAESVAKEEDISRDANRTDPRERAAGQPTFERA